MSPERYPSIRSFTVERANACLPLVRAITSDLVHLAQDINERRLRLEMLSADRKPRERDVYSEELSHARAELDKDEGRLEAYVEELSELGIEVQDPLQGLIDFPARLEGRNVYLCWKLGEPEILYWHELDAASSERRLLMPPRVVSGISRHGEFEGN